MSDKILNDFSKFIKEELNKKEITKEDVQYLERIIALPAEEFCEAVGVIMV